MGIYMGVPDHLFVETTMWTSRGLINSLLLRALIDGSLV